MRKFTNKELQIIGPILYSCEGTQLRKDKRRKNTTYYWVIEFTNSNPKLISLFVSFLRKIIKIDEKKLKGQLFAYKELDMAQLENYWSNISEIPQNNFNKTIILTQKNSKYKPNPNGTFKIRYHSKEAFKKLEKIANSILE
ncbi:MAG: hypothetical protein ABID35_04895 [Candidatus Margulisiibacteriota bacterium]